MMAVFICFILFSILVSGAPTSLVLKRTIPNHGMELSELTEMDMHRHGRMLQASVVNLTVHGATQIGLYYTTIYLGSPPREFHVQIDTGSDTSWVTCVSCTGCPQTSNLEIKLNYFDPVSSSTYSIIPCSHHKCEMCSTNNRCSFNNRYGDGGGASGYIVSDIMYVSNISMGPMAPNFSVSLVFGCSNLRTGRLALNDRALDGILGFGKQDTSLISQLYSQGKAPRVFSHCLKGDISGGGILVLGEVVEPNMTYSPLISKQPYYNLNLESIIVNEHILEIDPTIFMTSNNKGVVIDSGTTMAYFIEGAYNPIVDAINHTILQSQSTFIYDGFQCYSLAVGVLSITDIFPQILLNFAGHATLVLRPQDYLISVPIPGSRDVMWCLGFHKTSDITILGGSLPINISRWTGQGRSEKEGTLHLTMTIVLAFLTHVIFIFLD